MRHDGNGRTSKSICAQEPILTPERKLWRAVLEQAYADAELPQCERTGVALQASEPRYCGARSEFVPAARILARQYLRADTPYDAAGLALVCDFAEIPADRLIPWARKRYPLAA